MARAMCWRARRRRSEELPGAAARACAVALVSVAAAHAATTPLDAYLDDLRTLRARFVQTLVDAHGREIGHATGTLIVARPGKFSWEIRPQRAAAGDDPGHGGRDRKSTRLNSSHDQISYAVFCLKKKKTKH